MLNSLRIAEIVKGKLYGSSSADFQGCEIDSRRVTPGELFIAICGEKTDGHKFIDKAFEAGAAIVIGEARRLEEGGLPEVPSEKALIAVEDSLGALQELAKAWIKEVHPLVVAITGSCGKTTTKDMVAAVLAQKYTVHKNAENYNNELGLPLTILRSPRDIEVMVLEMGMRGLGQIDALCRICNPAIGVITNIGTTHMELLGSQEKIAQAKWELIEFLPEKGIAVLNAEDYYSVTKAGSLPPSIQKIFYGTKGEYAQPDVSGKNLQIAGSLKTIFEASIGDQNVEVTLPLPGKHNVLDALAALAVGHICGVPLAKGALALEGFKLSGMRLEMLEGISDSVIINDVYNANPASMKASLHVLAERGGEKTIAVLGEMYELGDVCTSGHREVGQIVAQLGIRELVTVGKLAQNIAQGAIDSGLSAQRVHMSEDCGQAADITRKLLEEMKSNTWILVKGSRGMKMEKISDLLKK